MKKALLIGINYIAMPTISLKGCIDDVENIQQLLISEFHYDISGIVMLKDDNILQHFMPTRENILRELKSIVFDSNHLNEIWIHYSGHGSQVPEIRSSKNGEPLDDAIVPVDYMETDFITGMELLSIIRQIKCAAIMVFDCCHSGTMCKLPWEFDFSVPHCYIRINIDNVYIENPHIFLFSGCKDDQNSYDIFSDALKESVGAFTIALIETLRELQYRSDIMVLYKEICRKMVGVRKQQPIFSSSSLNPVYLLHHFAFKECKGVGK